MGRFFINFFPQILLGKGVGVVYLFSVPLVIENRGYIKANGGPFNYRSVCFKVVNYYSLMITVHTIASFIFDRTAAG